MKILIISDAWYPQVNGVVRTLDITANGLQKLGHNVHVVGPDETSWRTIATPFYPSIKLEFFARPRLRLILADFNPDYIHIATEGPLGWAMRGLCLDMKRPFTTSYHTRFPEYLEARMPKGIAALVRMLAYSALHLFHTPSDAVMVTTPSMEASLKKRQFRRLVRWSRGVDTDFFRPLGKNLYRYAKMPRPILLYVGRVAVEKNLKAFLDLEMLGSKVIIGDGPSLAMLESKYPAAHFLGTIQGEALVQHYAAADLFVFPSLTDTFGLVLLEACACGLRIAGYPAPGPNDIFADESTRSFSVLDNNLGEAIRRALALPDAPALPRTFAEKFSWQASTQQFLSHLQPPPVKPIAKLRNWLGRRR